MGTCTDRVLGHVRCGSIVGIKSLIELAIYGDTCLMRSTFHSQLHLRGTRHIWPSCWMWSEYEHI